MIRLNVFVRVSETNREKAIEAAKELTTCSLKEEGCIAYDRDILLRKERMFLSFYISISHGNKNV